ncbi:MAG: carboxypeptidase regulatory-like domain-containing protein, partial [Acidobacteria bacterium]|nr:carboxypeptidase regulatory-like domain-containing protein [Acidobacteriota bacterium]
MRLYSQFTLLSLFALGAAMLFGQATSQLTGIVTDNTGAVVAGAEVTVTNANTGNERKATSNDSGIYTVPFLTPDRYTITVSRPGFRLVKREGIRLEVNQTARVDFQLELGAVTETVNVTAAAPLIDSDTSAIGQVIERKAIEDLPLNGRNFVQLAILGPGVVGVGFGARGTIMSGTRPDDLRPGSELFANGNREGSNNFLMDGVDNNERLTLAIVLRPSVEAVREFKIQTNLFAAEQGRNAGAAVNVITKSGTNEWHGSAYEYLRNNALDARNYFATTAAPALRQNQFGASFGGRIVRNRLFFFSNYEGYRRRQERTFVNTVPTLEMRNGNFTNIRDVFDPATTRAQAGTASGFVRDPFPARIIPSNRWDAVTRKLITAYPAPISAALVANQITNPKERQMWDQGDVRVDWNWNDRNTVFGRFSRQDTTTTRPSTFAPVSITGISTPVSLGNEDTFAGDSNLKAYNSVLSWIRTFTPAFL